MEAHGNHKPKICKRYTRNKEKVIKKKKLKKFINIKESKRIKRNRELQKQLANK